MPMTPAEFAAAWGWPELSVRRKARQLGACHVLGKRMMLSEENVDALRQAMDPVYRAQKDGLDVGDLRGFIYFAECEGCIKIGFARNVMRRIADLQKACPFPLRVVATFAGSLRDEQVLHERFASSRMHGEWFHFSDAIKAFIVSLKK